MQNIKIVLAEDDEDDRFFFRRALLESGIQTELTTVTNGEQLIDFLFDALKPFIPDVIFLDINMPGMDGKVCLREIRRWEKFSAIPVIILSTSTHVKDIDETYKAGANIYISKEVFYNDSVEWVKKLFPPDWQKGLTYPPRERFAFTT